MPPEYERLVIEVAAGIGSDGRGTEGLAVDNARREEERVKRLRQLIVAIFRNENSTTPLKNHYFIGGDGFSKCRSRLSSKPTSQSCGALLNRTDGFLRC